ncbi:MAG: phosphoenolpyruvate--protein phosphotransferase [Gammaproteobacteria bacterium]
MLEVLRRIVQEVNTAPDVPSALALLVKRVRDAMGAEVCSVYLLDEAVSRWVLMATEGLKKEAVGKATMGIAEGLVGQVGLREEPINLEDAFTHPKFQYLPEVGEEAFHAFLGVPVISQGKTLGVLIVQQRDRRRFDQSEEAFLVTIAAQLSGLVAHARATARAAAIAEITPEHDKIFIGVAGSPGAAIGKVKVIYPPAELESVPDRAVENIEQEVSRLENALMAVRTEIRRLGERIAGQLRPEEQALFDVWLRMLDKNALGGEIVNKVRESGNWAEGSLRTVIMAHSESFKRMEDVYLRDRAADVRDLGLRVLAQLQARALPVLADFPDDAIVVAEEMSATTLMDLPRDKIRAIATVAGSATSHMAIVARTMGIPVVLGLSDLPLTQVDGRRMIVDGFRGRAIVDPGREFVGQYEQIIRDEQNLVRELEPLRNLPASTQDGHHVALMVNTGLLADVQRSLGRGAEGVGLYRTEIPFMVRDRFPSEEEQRNIYNQQLAAFAPHPVVMRTLDIGGDKMLPYFPVEETNPFLGWRGIRITLDHPDIFLVQVRAMLKAGAKLNNLRILVPMVTNVFEAEEAMHLVHRAWLEVREEGVDVEMPPVGVMVEVPAAVFQARELAQRVDFLSVGSNDLTQYILAVDRNNPRVSGLYSGFHPAVLGALKHVVEAGHAEGKPVGICGELAGDPLATPLLMAMGFDSLSMNASSLLKVKWVVRNSTMAGARALLEEVLAMDNPQVIQSHLNRVLEKQGFGSVLARKDKVSAP